MDSNIHFSGTENKGMKYLPIAKWADMAILSMDRDHILKLCTIFTPFTFRKVSFTSLKSIPFGIPEEQKKNTFLIYFTQKLQDEDVHRI